MGKNTTTQPNAPLAIGLKTPAEQLDTTRSAVRQWPGGAGIRPTAIGRGRKASSAAPGLMFGIGWNREATQTDSILTHIPPAHVVDQNDPDIRLALSLPTSRRLFGPASPVSARAIPRRNLSAISSGLSAF